MTSYTSHELRKIEILQPSESNDYCVFDLELENDPLVLFHATPKRNFQSIVSHGFRSAMTLGSGTLESVSYAKKSSSCLAHIGQRPRETWTIFVVRFQSLDVASIRVNPSDIHVFDQNLQPERIGYGTVPAGMRWV